MPVARRLAVPALLAVSALSLAACGDGGSPASGETGTASGEEAITIVTATNVYGDIAATVGGDDVEVTSIVNSLSQDPHSYEATVQDKLSVSEADLVIENGGGYDTFLGRLAEETGVETVLSAVELSGLEAEAGTEEHSDEAAAEHGDEPTAEHADEPTGEHSDEPTGEHADEEGHDHGAFNEHVWYDLPAMATLADAIADELGRLDEANTDEYRSRADAFTAELQSIQDRLAALASEGPGGKVAVTEPVPVYLLEDAGLENVTPEEFSEAIEEETDVPVAALEEMKALVSGKTLAFLAYNDQTEGAQTEAVRSAADAAGLPVLDFTETLPDGENYISWMTANTDTIEAALS
ncbi:ABC transporter substrate-binding protein [Arthrobacter sp. NamB2]|uniref:metal ABC transporter solute-binding protein, Zn/Mn family n=1 Tax=Arthrobacter sp. NamB2 TaxID=2576035 RepID=UPI0010C966E4|nr:zinc ABC transporter substrate-binding protein [Arthrobacter sp. NamB2]TKV29752.1 ABC transporter substrate-binding protein [Arthrobacter sp. NamB2]